MDLERRSNLVFCKMNMRIKLRVCAASGAGLLALSGCQTAEAPKYSDLIKAWHPISIYHVADGTHIVVVQSITNGVESGKYIWPMFSSAGPASNGLVLRGWRGPTGSSLIDLGGRQGLATVLEYTRRQDGAAEDDADIGRKLTGTWTHNIPWIDARERTLILKGTQDAQGKMHFEFVKPPFSYKPIFTALSVQRGQVEIMFKMVLYSDELDVSRHTLQYVLREKNGIWSGQFLQSWVDSPVQVTLKKEE